MESDGSELLCNERDFFLLLLELSKTDKEYVNLEKLRADYFDLNSFQIQNRINLLSEKLDISEDSKYNITQDFAKILGKENKLSQIPRKSLLDILTKHIRGKKTNSIHSRYEEKISNFFHRSPMNFTFQNNDLHETSNYPYLDIRPLTRKWSREILESPAWNRIESPVPGVPNLSLEDTWVNLTLREIETYQSVHTLESNAWKDLRFNSESVGTSINQLLTKLQGLTVITGLPGAGKSTLMKWIARYLITEPNCRFGIPIFISLRQFAKERFTRSNLTLFEYFLELQGIKDESQILSWRNVAAGLLDPYEYDSDTPDAFLWLLDGWDEIPPDMQNSILPEIQSIALYPSIITTRHSSNIFRLPAEKYYEIQGLKHGAALDLAHRWLTQTGKSAYYASIEIGLEESADIRRMARSPFLLTLICALVSNPSSQLGGWLTRRRSELLSETLRMIYEQHNSDLKQKMKFGRQDQEDIAHFAFWLLAEAPEAPRYVFDSQDYQEATRKEGRFESLLIPSRLIAKPSIDSTDFQFLHASFQEYLAARNLLKKPNKIPRDGTFLFKQNWKEVARFLAETIERETEAWDIFWKEVQKAVTNLDKFGIVASRIAFLVSAAGERDGGQKLLGVDLRDHLWNVIKTFSAQVPTQPLEAYLELDAKDFARRILDHRIKTGKNSRLTFWLELISIFDIEMLFTDHEEYKKILALPEISIFFPDLPDWIFEDKSGREDFGESEILNGLETAISAKDGDLAKSLFWELLEKDLIDVASESLELFVKLPPDKANQILFEIAVTDSINDICRGNAVRILTRLGDKNTIDNLLIYLASKEIDDFSVFPILGNLVDYPLNSQETNLVLEFLKHSQNSEVRYAAAELMLYSRSKEVAIKMMEIFKSEQDEEVRLIILKVLGEIADDFSLDKIWQMYENDVLRNDEELGLWFRAVLIILDKRQRRVAAYGNAPSAAGIVFSILDLAKKALYFEKDDTGFSYLDLQLSLLEFPNILSRENVSQIRFISENEKLPDNLRIAAIRSLSKVDKENSVEFLNEIVNRSDEQTPESILNAAYDTLGEISPEELAKIKSEYAERAMARLAFRFNILFMENDTLNADGHSMSAREKTEKLAEIGFPFKADIAVFIALKEEFDLFHRIITEKANTVWSHWDDPKQSFTYYAYKIQPTSTKSAFISVVAVCAFEMGPQRAINISASLMERFDPENLVVIGIAGSLDNDLRLGDILVPNEVYSYLENSAVADVSDSWEFMVSGKHFACDSHLLNQVRQFARKYPHYFRLWETQATKLLNERINEDLLNDALDKNVTREIPKLVASDNHLATGSIVGKSNAFSEWIQKNNRKASAMEMETASVFDSANTRIENCRKLAIRGVSDFADSRKSLVEKNYKSKFREISMTNAVEFFVMLINADIFPRADRTTGSISTDSENKMLREKQLKEHISKDLALLNDYEDLIRLEEEPRRIAKYQREIDRLNFSISKYKNELHDLKS